MEKPVLLVTGGSRGIGAAIVRAAAMRYRVVINFHRAEAQAQALVSELKTSGGEALALAADVADPHAVKQMFAQIHAQFGLVAALVNNAGILERQSTFADTDWPRWQRIFNTNVMGSFLCAQAAIADMRQLGGGAIVNVSSAASRSGSPGEYVDYAASKGAIDSFTLGLAKELAPEKIRVNAVRPGFINTDMHASGGEPDRVQRLAPHLPMKRGGQPEEVAAAVLWLLSDEASYVTGAFLDVAGGR